MKATTFNKIAKFTKDFNIKNANDWGVEQNHKEFTSVWFEIETNDIEQSAILLIDLTDCTVKITDENFNNLFNIKNETATKWESIANELLNEHYAEEYDEYDRECEYADICGEYDRYGV